MDRCDQHRAEKERLYGKDKVKMLDKLEMVKTKELIAFLKALDGAVVAPTKDEEPQKEEDHEFFEWTKAYINELIETTLVKHKTAELNEKELSMSFVDDFKEIIAVKDHLDQLTEAAQKLVLFIRKTINDVQECLEKSGRTEEVKKALPAVNPSPKKRKRSK